MKRTLSIALAAILVFAFVAVPIAAAQTPGAGFFSKTPAAPAAPLSGAEAEPNNRPSQATPASAPGAVSGAIDPRGDHDWYSLSVGDAGELRTRISNPQPGSKMEMVFQVWNANLEAIQGWQGPKEPGQDTDNLFDLPRAGAYYLEVAEAGNDLASAAPYNLSLGFTPANDAGEPNGACSQAIPLASGAPVNAAILSRGDHDWYRIESPGRAEVRVAAVPPEPGMLMAVQVWNANRDVIAGWQQAEQAGETTDFIVDTREPGVYYLEVAQAGDNARSPMPYTLTATVTPTADVIADNLSFAKAMSIESGQAVQGSILPRGTHNWYRIESPGRAEVRVTAAPPEPDMLMAVQVWNANKDVIMGWQQAEQAGETTDFIVDTREPGPYYLEVAQASDNARSPKPYTLTATVTPTVDVLADNLSFAKAMSIDSGQAVQGSILPRGTHNWYRIESPGRAEVRVAVTPPEATMLMAVQVWNANKEVIMGGQQAEQAGETTDFIVDTREPGTYYLEVAQAGDNARSPMPYTLTATVTPAADVSSDNASFAQAQPVALGETVQASILPRGDHDWCAVEVPGPGRLTAAMSQNPAELKMVAQIWNADGQVVAGWQGAQTAGGDGMAVADVKEPGTYYIETASAGDGARSTGAYHLTVSFKGAQ